MITRSRSVKSAVAIMFILSIPSSGRTESSELTSIHEQVESGIKIVMKLDTDPPIAGRATRFVFRLTGVQSSEPVDAEKVNVRWFMTEIFREVERQHVDRQAPGIFGGAIELPKAARYAAEVNIVTLDGKQLFVSFPFRAHGEPKDATGGGHEGRPMQGPAAGGGGHSH